MIRDEFRSLLTPEGGGCLVWTRSRIRGGYGQLKIGGRVLRAHRVAFELWNGPIPVGVFVCHSCDNPPCCNPDHLFIGTAADNVADMLAKGRGQSATGARNYQAKLTPEIVNEARRAHLAGASGRALARQYGVSHPTMQALLTGHTWRWVQ